jgi:hypothetical protein
MKQNSKNSLPIVETLRFIIVITGAHYWTLFTKLGNPVSSIPINMSVTDVGIGSSL